MRKPAFISMVLTLVAMACQPSTYMGDKDNAGRETGNVLEQEEEEEEATDTVVVAPTDTDEEVTDEDKVVCSSDYQLCDDGDACTLKDYCKSGTCKSGVKLECDDGDICTNDLCNVITGCVAPPDYNACEDNNPCTTDSCDHTFGCVHTPVESTECNEVGPVTDEEVTDEPAITDVISETDTPAETDEEVVESTDEPVVTDTEEPSTDIADTETDQPVGTDDDNEETDEPASTDVEQPTEPCATVLCEKGYACNATTGACELVPVVTPPKPVSQTCTITADEPFTFFGADVSSLSEAVSKGWSDGKKSEAGSVTVQVGSKAYLSFNLQWENLLWAFGHGATMSDFVASGGVTVQCGDQFFAFADGSVTQFCDAMTLKVGEGCFIKDSGFRFVFRWK